MTAKIFKLLPDAELKILEAFINRDSTTDLESIYQDLDIPHGYSEVSRISIAVAQILLHNIQDTLPNWGYTKDDDTVVLGRLPHQRHKDARLNFNPKHVVTINWADSGPGFSWPEAYYITYLPSFNKYIVTASRDSEDAYGCTDHAIGVADGNLGEIKAAKEVIIKNWHEQFDSYDQSRWAYLFNEGLIDTAISNQWADEVWDDDANLEDEQCDEA